MSNERCAAAVSPALPHRRCWRCSMNSPCKDSARCRSPLLAATSCPRAPMRSSRRSTLKRSHTPVRSAWRAMRRHASWSSLPWAPLRSRSRAVGSRRCSPHPCRPCRYRPCRYRPAPCRRRSTPRRWIRWWRTPPPCTSSGNILARRNSSQRRSMRVPPMPTFSRIGGPLRGLQATRCLP